MNTISFEHIAKQLHVSRTYLSQLFTRVMGISFIQYLTQFRINKAKQFLCTGRYMVSQVGELVGYPDPPHFSKVFKRISGQSPAEFMIYSKE